MLSLPEWRPRHLLAAWVAYWFALLVLWLGSAIGLLYRLSRAGGHGTASLSASDGVLGITVTAGSHTLTHTISYGLLTALVVVPPLLLWGVWVAVRPRRVV